MTVRRLDDGAIALEGDCGAEDAEALLQALLQTPGASVDWQACDRAHAAVVQLLAAAKVRLRGPARSTFLREVVEPALKRE